MKQLPHQSKQEAVNRLLELQLACLAYAELWLHINKLALERQLGR